MACNGCSTGRGSHNAVPMGCKDNGSCGTGGCNKLNVFDWLSNMSLPGGQTPCDIVEIRFKNSRKEFFKNVNNLPVNVGDVVAVEASPGHDIGVISLTGELVKLQMKKKNVHFDSEEIKKIYRKAKSQDIDKWREAQSLEVTTMYKARTLALNLGLQMKISDVEFQGDKSKAIFYYTAEGRVDFRELIKVMATEFGVRIEMRQIGARQEASRLGGIGSCGRELCCSTWLTDFRTVSTSAARYQQLSLNPLKLAGQCGKLKCCLNYELDSYLDALKEFPEIDNRKLQTLKGNAFHQKTDIFRRIIWWSYTSEPDVFVPLSIERTKLIFKMNDGGEKPDELQEAKPKGELFLKKEPDFENVVGQDSLTRFDARKKQGGGQRRGRDRDKQAKQGGTQNQNAQQQQAQGEKGQQKPQNQQQGRQRQQGQGKPQNQQQQQARGPKPQHDPNKPKQQNQQRDPNKPRPQHDPNKPKPENQQARNPRQQQQGEGKGPNQQNQGEQRKPNPNRRRPNPNKQNPGNDTPKTPES